MVKLILLTVTKNLLMKLYIKRYYILIISNKLMNLIAGITGFDGKGSSKAAMGVAIPPCFIVLRNLSHPLTPQWINHERIHIRQNLETLCFAFVIAKIEYFYARIFLKYTKAEANRFEFIEQEAYLNQHNSDYLKQRKIFSSFKYIFRKKKFHSDENYNLILD
jgi:hypothetical protein